MIAEMQSITYGQYLPIVLGSQDSDLKLHAAGTKYDPIENPSITNEFATAAFRFGHSMIQGIIKMYATDGSGQLEELDSFLRNDYFNMTNYALNDGLGMEQTIMGLMYQASQVDVVFFEKNRNFSKMYFFEIFRKIGLENFQKNRKILLFFLKI
jgi:peroxidase